jgi:hypothetical protein
MIFRRKSLNMKTVVMILFSSFLGLLLTAIQFLPAAELYMNSQRVSEFFSKDLVYLPWQNLLSFLAPDFFGNHSTGNFWGVGDYTNNVGFSGIITLSFAIIAIGGLFKKTEIKFFLSILFISLLLSLENPISSFIWRSGFLGSSASCNTRILVLANLSLSALAAFGIDHALKTKKKINIVPNLINSIFIHIFHREKNALITFAR